MVEKLKLISRETLWFLWLKAFLVALAWYLFSYSAFLVAFFLLYSLPLFDPFRLLLPLFAMSVISALLPQTALSALLVGLYFFLIVGIKDLLLVRRREAYQALTLLLFSAGSLLFFSRMGNPAENFFLPLSLLVLFYFLLARRVLSYEAPETIGEKERTRALLGFGCASLFLLELGGALLFLPLNYFYATALFFLSGTLLLDLVLQYARQALTRNTILRAISFFISFVVIIGALTSWEL
jgi:hypothetical protein